jgi:Rod binding domain-containing protein
MNVTSRISEMPTLNGAEASSTHNPKSEIRDPKLRKACQDMESYFVGMLLKKMHESASKGGLFEQKSVTTTYREMFDDAIAAEIGKRGAFGIAGTLYKELSAQAAVLADGVKE